MSAAISPWGNCWDLLIQEEGLLMRRGTEFKGNQQTDFDNVSVAMWFCSRSCMRVSSIDPSFIFKVAWWPSTSSLNNLLQKTFILEISNCLISRIRCVSSYRRTDLQNMSLILGSGSHTIASQYNPVGYHAHVYDSTCRHVKSIQYISEIAVDLSSRISTACFWKQK